MARVPWPGFGADQYHPFPHRPGAPSVRFDPHQWSAATEQPPSGAVPISARKTPRNAERSQTTDRHRRRGPCSLGAAGPGQRAAYRIRCRRGLRSQQSADLGSDRPGASVHSDSSAHHALTPQHDPHVQERGLREGYRRPTQRCRCAIRFHELVLVAPITSIACDPSGAECRHGRSDYRHPGKI